METAPKDATVVRLFFDDGGRSCDAHWAHGGGEDQPPFGPAWFKEVSIDGRHSYFAEIHEKPIGWLRVGETYEGR